MALTIRKWLTARDVGVCMCAESASAVARDGAEGQAAHHVKRAIGEGTGSMLVRLLQAVPRGRRRIRVTVAVGPSASQLRNLAGAGWTQDLRVAADVVRVSPARYFLAADRALRTTTAERALDGGAWVAAIDSAVVDEIVAACAEVGARLMAIAPAAAVLGSWTAEPTVEWRDGGVVMVASYQDGFLMSHRRVLAEDGVRAAEDDRRPELGVAQVLASRRVVTRLTIPLQREGAGHAASSWLAAAACAAALAFALVAPPVAASRSARNDRAQAALVAGSARRARAAEVEAGTAARVVRELNAFARSSRSATMALAALTQGIDESTMLLSVQADTGGATIVAITPRAADLMRMLDSIPSITGARIVGAVTPNTAGAPLSSMSAAGGAIADERETPMERVTARVSWKGAPAGSQLGSR